MTEQQMEAARRIVGNMDMLLDDRVRAIAQIVSESCEGRHRFEPRYSKKPVQMMHGVRDAETYVCDVCIYCGKVVGPEAKEKGADE